MTRPQLHLSIAVLLALGVTDLALAQTQRIAGTDKHTSGRITELTAGDVACYVSFEPGNGETVNEMAEFEICERTDLIGREVRFAYTIGNVIADECEGNPDCGKSQQVALIHEVTPLAAGEASAGGTPEAAPTTAPQGYCLGDEVTIFHCTAGAKQISVCGSLDIGSESGYVQYRFGKPGQTPEMQKPDARTPAARRAGAQRVYGRAEGWSGGGGAWLRFYNGNTSYTVYSGIGNWAEDGGKLEKAGVAVERGGKLLANVGCDGGTSAGELGPEWLETVGFAPDHPDEEFLFPE